MIAGLQSAKQVAILVTTLRLKAFNFPLIIAPLSSG